MGILQARILEWVAIPFFRGSFQSRDQTQVSRTAGRFFTIWASKEVQISYINAYIWNLERWYWWTCMQGKNRDTDIENRRVDKEGAGEGGHIKTVTLPRIHAVQFSSVSQSCLTLCDSMDCSTPGLPVHHQLPESTQTHVHWVGDASQPSHPLSSPSPPALNLSQHQGLFQWVSSLHQVAKVLEFQLQHR